MQQPSLWHMRWCRFNVPRSSTEFALSAGIFTVVLAMPVHPYRKPRLLAYNHCTFEQLFTGYKTPRQGLLFAGLLPHSCSCRTTQILLHDLSMGLSRPQVHVAAGLLLITVILTLLSIEDNTALRSFKYVRTFCNGIH